MRLPRVCIVDGCPEIAVLGTIRCRSHPSARSPSSRATSAGGWKAIRARILKRDNHVCHYCGGRASTVDHVLAVAMGGTNDPSNLVASCWPCNSKKGAKRGPHS